MSRKTRNMQISIVNFEFDLKILWILMKLSETLWQLYYSKEITIFPDIINKSSARLSVHLNIASHPIISDTRQTERVTMDTMARWILRAGERTWDTTVSSISTISQTQNTTLTGGYNFNCAKCHQLKLNCNCKAWNRSFLPSRLAQAKGNNYRKYFCLSLALAIKIAIKLFS